MNVYSAKYENDALVVTEFPGCVVDGILFDLRGTEKRIGAMVDGFTVRDGESFSDSEEAAVGGLLQETVKRLRENHSRECEAAFRAIRFWYGGAA